MSDSSRYNLYLNHTISYDIHGNPRQSQPKISLCQNPRKKNSLQKKPIHEAKAKVSNGDATVAVPAKKGPVQRIVYCACRTRDPRMDKAALAQYFDNDNPVADKNAAVQAWYDQVAQELEAKDKRKEKIQEMLYERINFRQANTESKKYTLQDAQATTQFLLKTLEQTRRFIKKVYLIDYTK